MNKVRQADYGTPEPRTVETVKVEIDGLPTTVKAGTSILRAARESGVDIPKLCATDSLKPFGSCRMCLVEVEGRKGFRFDGRGETGKAGSPILDRPFVDRIVFTLRDPSEQVAGEPLATTDP